MDADYIILNMSSRAENLTEDIPLHGIIKLRKDMMSYLSKNSRTLTESQFKSGLAAVELVSEIVQARIDLRNLRRIPGTNLVEVNYPNRDTTATYTTNDSH